MSRQNNSDRYTTFSVYLTAGETGILFTEQTLYTSDYNLNRGYACDIIIKPGSCATTLIEWQKLLSWPYTA